MRAKAFVAMGTGVAVIALTAGSAYAAVWGKSESGRAEVCFTQTGFDAVAKQQAEVEAANWNAVSTNLDVSFEDCSDAANVIPMKLGNLATDVYGETKWLENRQGEFVSANITFDDGQAGDWAQQLAELRRTGESTQEAAVWRQLLCHEMGHALGLAHSSAKDSCMQTVVSVPFEKPGAGDVAQLRKLYGGAAKDSRTDDGEEVTTTTRPSKTTTTVEMVNEDNAGGAGEGDAGDVGDDSSIDDTESEDEDPLVNDEETAVEDDPSEEATGDAGDDDSVSIDSAPVDTVVLSERTLGDNDVADDEVVTTATTSVKKTNTDSNEDRKTSSNKNREVSSKPRTCGFKDHDITRQQLLALIKAYKAASAKE